MTIQVDYLSKEHIEAATLKLLTEYGKKYGKVIAPPIPIEEILEAHLGVNFTFDDLPKLLGMPDVLGATWFQDQKVIIDETLDPTVHPEKEGRYRFTVAHELGHWDLHKHLVIGNSGQSSLFDEEPEPSIVCRSSSKPPIEWQADQFASYLLMPEDMVCKMWKDLYGRLEPYVAAEEIRELSIKWGLDAKSQPTVPTVDFAREMAQEFKVSGQAMQIRLTGLGLIKTEKAESGLFERKYG
jgi:Zn-dependent peptidase ImmA (M78 family)